MDRASTADSASIDIYRVTKVAGGASEYHYIGTHDITHAGEVFQIDQVSGSNLAYSFTLRVSYDSPKASNVISFTILLTEH